MTLAASLKQCASTVYLYEMDRRWPVLPWCDRTRLMWDGAPRAYIVILNPRDSSWSEIHLHLSDPASCISDQLFNRIEQGANRIGILVDDAVHSTRWLALTLSEFEELNMKPWNEIPHCRD